MADRNGRHGLRAAAVAAVALALAGCAADYVGEDWQCPLAQGEVCTSVAAADPAVPESLVPGTLVPKAWDAANLANDVPLYRRNDASAVTRSRAATAAEADCESGCGPLAWLAGLFAGPADPESGEPERADTGRGADIGVAGPVEAKRIAAASAPDGDAPTATAGETLSAGASLPADESPLGKTRDGWTAADDTLRTGEVVARIWIAPFVDAGGIYREGAYVRAVIAPAEWRLP